MWLLVPGESQRGVDLSRHTLRGSEESGESS